MRSSLSYFSIRIETIVVDLKVNKDQYSSVLHWNVYSLQKRNFQEVANIDDNNVYKDCGQSH